MDSLYNWSDLTKIGVGLTTLGIIFFGLGVMMMLDSVLLTMGNMLFISGVAAVMGPRRCSTFFRMRTRASLFFFFGALLVFCRYCFLGLCIQGFGGLNLFGNFIPVAIRVLEALPLIGPLILSAPVQRTLRLLQLDGNRGGRNV